MSASDLHSGALGDADAGGWPGLAAAKDLTREEPRGLTSELEGYVWLPRMFDKARATLAGTAGSYLFGCPVDHTCMARLGIAPEQVLDLVARHADDHAALAALRERGVPSAAGARFDPVAVEDELQGTGLYLRVREAGALPEAAGGRVFSGSEHGAGVSVVVIDAKPGESQPRHRHPFEEVVVIHEGAARFLLGEQQQRIVRAGQVVRVPAGVEHGWVVEPGTPLRAVAAYAADEVVTLERD